MSDEQEWKPTPLGQERARARLARIDQQHVTLPVCALRGCGQRTARLDEFGLCSKVSITHRQVRDASRVQAPARTMRGRR